MTTRVIYTVYSYEELDNGGVIGINIICSFTDEKKANDKVIELTNNRKWYNERFEYSTNIVEIEDN